MGVPDFVISPSFACRIHKNDSRHVSKKVRGFIACECEYIYIYIHNLKMKELVNKSSRVYSHIVLLIIVSKNSKFARYILNSSNWRVP